jgi:hypothetical protein
MSFAYGSMRKTKQHSLSIKNWRSILVVDSSSRRCDRKRRFSRRRHILLCGMFRSILYGNHRYVRTALIPANVALPPWFCLVIYLITGWTLGGDVRI